MHFASLLPLGLIFGLVLNVASQVPNPTPPSPVKIDGREVKELRLTMPSLADEVRTSEVEPRQGQFRINLRFLRARYSRPKIGNNTYDQYEWDYFSEANVVVKSVPTAINAYSMTSAADRRGQLAKEIAESVALQPNIKITAERDVAVGDELGKEYDLTINGKSVTQRVFVHNGIYYAIIVEAKKSDARPQIEKLLKSFEFLPLPRSAASVEKNVFRSEDANFTIDIPSMPLRTIDKSTFEARLKKIDAGRQFIWVFGRNSVSVFYTPPFTPAGEPEPNKFSDMETGTRKGILNAGLRVGSEKPFKIGSVTGTEFRYVANETVNFINRVFIVGDTGYQLMGSYADPKDEAEVTRILDSFKPIRK
ncbi:MAG: hypothetical protein ABL999_19650 [Pyrinomonadaceae bacterium]